MLEFSSSVLPAQSPYRLRGHQLTAIVPLMQGLLLHHSMSSSTVLHVASVTADNRKRLLMC